MKHRSRDLLKWREPIIIYSSALLLIACSSCDQGSSPRSIEHRHQQVQEPPCLKVGEQCKIRRGLLGVCLPGEPGSESMEGSAEAGRGLICTPQH